MDEAAIQTTENGPLKVVGPVRLIDSEGGRYELDRDAPAYLCRCGASNNKPFCDGTHAAQGFGADERAAPSREGKAG